MTTNKAKGTRAIRAGKLIAGIRKLYPNGSQVLTSGALGSVTVDEAVGELQAIVDHRQAVTAAQATARDTVQAEREALPDLVAHMSAMEALVRFAYSNDSTALAECGLAQRKQPTPMTAEQMVVAVAKRKATREARGTRGPKAKRAIKGNVTARVVVTPASAAQDAAPGTPGEGKQGE